MEGQLAVVLSGSPTATTLSITIPNGAAVDETKLPTITAGLYIVGSFLVWDDSLSALRGGGQVFYNRTSNNLDLYIVTTAPNTSTQVSSTVPITFANDDYLSVYFSVPISGW